MHRIATLMLHMLLPVLATAPGLVRAEKPRVAILDVTTTRIDPSLATIFTEILTSEAHGIGTHNVIAGRDIAAMLGFEKQKELMGCDEVSCLAELGGALGVQFVVASDIAALGKTFVVNVKLINITEAKVEGRVYETVKGEVDEVIGTIRRAVHRLFPGGKPPQTRTREPAPAKAVATPASATAAQPPAVTTSEAQTQARQQPTTQQQAAVPTEAQPDAAQATKHSPDRAEEQEEDKKPTRRYGIILGFGYSRAEMDRPAFARPGDDWEGSAIMFPHNGFFYYGEWLNFEWFGIIPVVGPVASAWASLELNVSGFLSLGSRYQWTAHKLLEHNSEEVRTAVHSMMLGLVVRPSSRLRIAIYKGVNVGGRVSAPVGEISFDRGVDAIGPPLAVEAQYFITDHLGIRSSWMSTGGSATWSGANTASEVEMWSKTTYSLLALCWDFTPYFAD